MPRLPLLPYFSSKSAMPSWIILFASILGSAGLVREPIFSTTTGYISFSSEAPLEIVKASSDRMKGLIQADQGTMAFSVDMTSFQGFNSPLQREHFNENFMESARFPTASFSGKMIDKPDLTRSGTYEVRVKGILTVHGIPQERIIRGKITASGEKITLTSEFTVLLQEHEITIPRVMNQKIAEEITVSVRATLLPK